MNVVSIEMALSVIAQVIERNTQFYGVDLGRGMFASIQTELIKGAQDVANTTADTAAEQ